MKRLILLFTLSLVGMTAVGCGERACAMLAPIPHCVVCIKTTLGEEAILLAQSNLYDKEQQLNLYNDFTDAYGQENIKFTTSAPPDLYDSRCRILTPKDTPVYCYELTLTVNVDEALEDITIGYDVVKKDEDTRIYKFYNWAFGNSDASGIVAGVRNFYLDNGEGEIISLTMKKLGAEVHNQSIIF